MEQCPQIQLKTDKKLTPDSGAYQAIYVNNDWQRKNSELFSGRSHSSETSATLRDRTDQNIQFGNSLDFVIG